MMGQSCILVKIWRVVPAICSQQTDTQKQTPIAILHSPRQGRGKQSSSADFEGVEAGGGRAIRRLADGGTTATATRGSPGTSTTRGTRRGAAVARRMASLGLRLQRRRTGR